MAGRHRVVRIESLHVDILNAEKTTVLNDKAVLVSTFRLRKKKEVTVAN